MRQPAFGVSEKTMEEKETGRVVKKKRGSWKKSDLPFLEDLRHYYGKANSPGKKPTTGEALRKIIAHLNRVS
jgi:hypothetical protein